MFKSRTILAGAFIALVALALLVSPSSALAKKHQTKAKGPITAIDTTAGTVTIADKKSGESVTVTVDASTRIHKNEQEHATLADLAVGDKANARYNTTTLIAKRIQAKSPKAAKVEGTITAVDLTANTVTIQTEGGDLVTVIVTDTTRLERNDEEAELSAFAVGDQAEAKYNPVTMEAAKLEATGP